MKKAEQKDINDMVESYYDEIVNVLNEQVCRRYEQLYTCNARVYDAGRCKVLVSYNTKVAVYDPATKTVYDKSRKAYGYTATTAQHVNKFARFCGAEKVLHYRPI